MRHRLAQFALVALWASLALSAPSAHAQQLSPLLQADGALHPSWRFVGFPKKQAALPPTRFEPGRIDGEPAVQVLAASSYGTLVHDLTGAPPASLQWRWRLDEPLAGGHRAPDLSTKAGDDAALKVCALFNHPLERVPFVERTVLRLARSISGEDLPAATVCYVWDSAHAAGRQGANPYTRRVRYISLRGSDTPTRQWVSESRQLAQDFATLFADEWPPDSPAPTVRSVLIGADSDNTGSRSSGWVADLRTSPSSP